METLARDVLTFLGAFERHAVEPVTGRTIGKKWLQRLSELLRRPDPGYASFLAHFVVEEKFLLVRHGHWTPNRAKLSRSWDPAVILETAFRFWLSSPLWNESLPDPDVLTSVRRRYVVADPGLESRRRRICEELLDLPEDGVPFSGLFARAEKALPQRGGQAVGAEETLRRMLRGPLSWFGVVTGDPTQTVSLAPGAEAILRGRWSDLRSAWSPLTSPHALPRLQPTLEVLAPPDLTPERYLKLCRVADLRRSDVVSTFELTKESVLQALDRGLSEDDVFAACGVSSDAELPATARQLVADCAKRHGEVRLRFAGKLLEVRDDHLADELSAHPKISPQLVERLAPKIFAVGDDTTALTRDLKKAGYAVVGDAPRQQSGVGEGFRVSPEDLDELYAAVRLALHVVRERDPERDVNALAHLEDALGLELTRHEDSVGKIRARELVELVDRGAKSNPSSPPKSTTASGPDSIRELLEHALAAAKPVEIEYDGFQGLTTRVVEPESFDGRYLTGHCRLRDDRRTFNTAKILRATLTE